MAVSLAPMTADHWGAVTVIYREGTATSDATFEKSVPPSEEWDTRHLPSCRLVALSQGEVTGWSALSPVSGRCVYGGIAEVSVYVADRARGQGVERRSAAAGLSA